MFRAIERRHVVDHGDDGDNSMSEDAMVPYEERKDQSQDRTDQSQDRDRLRENGGQLAEQWRQLPSTTRLFVQDLRPDEIDGLKYVVRRFSDPEFVHLFEKWLQRTRDYEQLGRMAKMGATFTIGLASLCATVIGIYMLLMKGIK